MVHISPTIPTGGIMRTLDTLNLAIQGIKEIGSIILSIAKMIGFFKTDIHLEELGDKAIQAEEKGIIPKKYETYAEYIVAIEQFNVDSEQSKIISEELKVLKGIEVSASAIIEKFVGCRMPEFIEIIIKLPEYFTEERLHELMYVFEQNGEFINAFVEYISGNEKDDIKIQDTLDKLVSIEKKINKEVSDKDALKNVLALRN